MKPLMTFGCCVALIINICGSQSFAEEGGKTLSLPTGTMTLQAPENSDPPPKLSPVVFPHSLHFQYSCKDCHHAWDGESPVKSCATADCHENLWASAPGKTPAGEKRIKSLAGAYHQVCRDCHRDELKQQRDAKVKSITTGPIACEGCHPEPHSEVVNEIENLTIPLGSLTITAPEGAETKREPVEFPHGNHFQFACQDCHHLWDGESEIESCAAADCHDQVEPDPATRNIKAEENINYYLAAYHNTCIPCHKETTEDRKAFKKAGITDEADLPAAGPVACNGCH